MPQFGYELDSYEKYRKISALIKSCHLQRPEINVDALTIGTISNGIIRKQI